MSENNINNTGLSKSAIYAIAFTAIAIIIIIIYLLINKDDNQTNTPSASGNNPVTQNTVPDATRGDPEATMSADILFRDIDFSLTQEDILAKEKELTDTLDEPEILKGTDDFTYIIYKSNPDNPLSFNGFAVTNDSNAGLYYAFRGKTLEEVRIQYGQLPASDSDGLVSSLRGMYGESTFYRSTSGALTYWWKSSELFLMVNIDNAGTTLYYRRNQ